MLNGKFQPKIRSSNGRIISKVEEEEEEEEEPALAKAGQICNGWNKKKRRPYPSCEEGLRCVFSGKPAAMGQENICVAPTVRRKKRSKKLTPAVRVVQEEEEVVSEKDEEKTEETPQQTTEPQKAEEIGSETFSWGFDPYVVLSPEVSNSSSSWMPIGDIQNAIEEAGIVW